jgi:hypothetical protein
LRGFRNDLDEDYTVDEQENATEDYGDVLQYSDHMVEEPKNSNITKEGGAKLNKVKVINSDRSV